MKKTLALVLALMMCVGLLAACGGGKDPAPAPDPQPESGTPSSAPAEPANSEGNTDPDTITFLLPPLSATYGDQLDRWAADFNALYPNLTLEFESASWEDYNSKLDVMTNAGAPPDIAYVQNDVLGKHVDSGLAVDISSLIDPATLADYDDYAVDFYRLEGGLYGLPLYISIHALGGNKEMMTAAGIDWEKAQKEGWTFDEFREGIKNGTTADTYGFIFACSGVAAKDYLLIMAQNAGMSAPFDEDLKYTYTSENFLQVLEDLRLIIDDGSAPKELNSIEAGMRWNMFLRGEAMLFGKGLANFEDLANKNNQKIIDNAEPVDGSVEVDYAVMPVPTFMGQAPASFGAVGGYTMFRGKDEPDPVHLENVLKALVFMSSGEPAAFTCDELYLSGLSNTTRELIKDITHEIPRDPGNAAATAMLTSNINPARPDIPAELLAKNNRLMDEVIVPKFQALLANEITPQEMYDAVYAAAVEVFGEDGVQ